MSSEICSTFFLNHGLELHFHFLVPHSIWQSFLLLGSKFNSSFPFPYLVLPTSVTADKSIALDGYGDMPLFKVNLLFGVSFMTILAKYEIKYVKCWHHPVSWNRFHCRNWNMKQLLLILSIQPFCLKNKMLGMAEILSYKL